MTADFHAWPKTPRLRRDCTITEKIDGTNSQINILAEGDLGYAEALADPAYSIVGVNDQTFLVAAGSRKRWLTPTKQGDNFGFAAFVGRRAHELVEALGKGRHYGEWWGSGIQRGYGYEDMRAFSLFNTAKYGDLSIIWPGELLGSVPVLATGTFSDGLVHDALEDLRDNGSRLAVGHPAEGICVYHHHANQIFKVLIENDAEPKSVRLKERDAA